MPDALPVSRRAIEVHMKVRGITRAAPGESGVFDEHGNYRRNPLTGHSAEYLARQRRARKHPLPSEYAELIRAGLPARRIASKLQVPEARVVRMADLLGLKCAPVNGKKLNGEKVKAAPMTPPAAASAAATEYPRARSGPAQPGAPSTRRGTLEGRGQARRADSEGRQDDVRADVCVPEHKQPGAACRPETSVQICMTEGETPAADTERQRAYRACHAAGMSTGSIARTMGVSQRHVRRMLWQLGLEPHPPIYFRRPSNA